MTAAAVAALAAMGAFHGLNPGMGWLFAVAQGFAERSRLALLRALGPIAAGHAASIFVVAGLVSALQSVVATRAVAIGGGAVLAGFGLWRALSRHHYRWTGMSLSPLQLSAWSLLMSSIHGAGLMLVPFLVSGAIDTGAHHHDGAAAGSPLWGGFLATAVHTAGMITTAGAVALLVYQAVGLRLFNASSSATLDRIWAIALLGAGIATVAVAI